GLRESPDLSDREARKKYYDALIASKKELTQVPVTDDKLVELREAEAKNQEDFMFAQRKIEDARVPSQLDPALEQLGRVLKAQHGHAAALGEYCGMPVSLPFTASTAAALTAAPSAAPAAPTASASAPAPEQWTTFRHPTLPFEALFFAPPEVGERKGPSSVTNAAIAEGGDRMLSVAHILFPSPPSYDCGTFLEVHIKGKQDRFQCKRAAESKAKVGDLPSLEATLECADGATILKRVSCISTPAEKKLVLFDVEAVYLRNYNAAEARKFVDSAKLLPSCSRPSLTESSLSRPSRADRAPPSPRAACRAPPAALTARTDIPGSSSARLCGCCP
ncbi:MAG: hypothetical protein R3B70_48030, partial [Polyangiaceae bacterium]